MRKQKEYEQIDLFAFSDNFYRIKKPIRLIEFFAGVGFQRLGIEKTFGDKVESWRTCEWAIPSIIAYDLVHNENRVDEKYEKDFLVEQLNGISANYNEPLSRKQIEKMPYEKLNHIYNCVKRNHNLINIMNVKGEDLGITNTDNYEYILTYSFPCQDLSLAGDKKGMEISQTDGGTRSGLVWEVLRILKECKEKPQILLMENVTQIHSLENIEQFNKLQLELEQLGYVNFWKDLNGVDFNVPQNRVRTFMVSIHQKGAMYSFPNREKLTRHLIDVLEPQVDEKYYLSQKMVDYLTGVNQKESKYDRGAVFERNLDPNKNCAFTITTASGQRPTDNFIISDDERNKFNYGRQALNETLEKNETQDGYFIDAYNSSINSDISGTITTRINESNNYFVANKYEEYMTQNKCDIPEMFNPYNKTEVKDVAPTQATNCGCTTCSSTVLIKEEYDGTFDYAQSDTLRPTAERRYHKDNDISGTILASGNQNGIAVKIINNNSKGYLEAHEGDGINICSRMEYQRGYVQKGKAQTLTCQGGNNVGVVTKNLRIRKLTPLECCRLMGADDIVDEKLKLGGLSDAQRYHIYGDGLIVQIPQKIIEMMKE